MIKYNLMKRNSFFFWKRKGKVEVLYDIRNVSVCMFVCIYICERIKEKKLDKGERFCYKVWNME